MRILQFYKTRTAQTLERGTEYKDSESVIYLAGPENASKLSIHPPVPGKKKLVFAIVCRGVHLVVKSLASTPCSVARVRLIQRSMPWCVSCHCLLLLSLIAMAWEFFFAWPSSGFPPSPKANRATPSVTALSLLMVNFILFTSIFPCCDVSGELGMHSWLLIFFILLALTVHQTNTLVWLTRFSRRIQRPLAPVHISVFPQNLENNLRTNDVRQLDSGSKWIFLSGKRCYFMSGKAAATCFDQSLTFVSIDSYNIVQRVKYIFSCMIATVASLNQ